MAKPNIDDEIDLIELIQIFWHHRIKFIVIALLGLILGLMFTFTHEPEYTTDFSFTLGHPIVNDDVLSRSSLLQKKLNDSTLNPAIYPKYSYKKNGIYTIKMDIAEARATIESLLIEGLSQEVNQIKLVASMAQEVAASKQVIIINGNQNNDIGLINFTNADLANLNVQDVISSLKISFSKTKSSYPNPFKHGLIGIFSGVVLGFMWIILAIPFSKLNLNNPKRKT